MRLSGLSVVAVLLFTSSLLAQHTTSAPAPSPAPSPVASASAPSPAPSMSSSASSSASMSHASAPSPASAPESHVSASPNPVASHASVSASPSSVSSVAAAPVRTSESGARRVDSQEKLDGTEGKIVPARRIGDDPPEKDHEAKPADPDLRHRVCENGACKEPVVAKPLPESDLRRRVCVNGTCPCGPGETAVKNGCVAAAAEVRAQDCQAGASWNGASCVESTTECASITGQAAALAAELRSIKAEMQNACTSDPSGSECSSTKGRLEDARVRYRMLVNGALPQCRTGLADESSLL
jgi:hypothetical protein